MTRSPKSRKIRQFLRKRGSLIVFVSIFSVLLALPFYYQTSSYPLAIVQGNSMFPHLQSGDLVLYRSVPPTTTLPVGTIILFVQGGTGVPEFDSLIKPVVIHRIVSIVVSDGTVYYQTKGDNNAINDSQLIPTNHILGTPVQIFPKLGLALLFFESPQGLVAVVALIVILYLSRNEANLKREEDRELFLGTLAEMVLNGELRQNAFQKIKLATEYEDEIQPKVIRDTFSLELLDWLKKGGLDKRWKQGKAICPNCSGTAASFESIDGSVLLVCPTCLSA